MSGDTTIEWTDAVWNCIRGCSRVSSGCEHCYAELIAARFSGPGQAYEGLARRRSNGEPQWTGEVRVIAAHLYDPLKWRAPRRIFVNSMSDLYHENVAVDTIAEVFAVMALAPRHTFQILTKRPARQQELLNDPAFRELVGIYVSNIAIDSTDPHERRTDDLRATAPDVEDDDQWPLKNVWLGVSTENQATADERIPLLRDTLAAIRFISAEPLLGPIDLSPHLEALSWVIVGGESGPDARPCDLEWVEAIVADCDLEGVACFVKQLGSKPVGIEDRISHRNNAALMPDGYYRFLNSSKGGDPTEWPERFRVRQFPLEVTRGR